MNEAMNKFNSRVFKKDHKSYYNETALAMLNENRTVPPTGLSVSHTHLRPHETPAHLVRRLSHAKKTT